MATKNFFRRLYAVIVTSLPMVKHGSEISRAQLPILKPEHESYLDHSASEH